MVEWQVLFADIPAALKGARSAGDLKIREIDANRFIDWKGKGPTPLQLFHTSGEVSKSTTR